MSNDSGSLRCRSVHLGPEHPQHPALPKRLIGDYGYWSRTQTPPYSSAQIPFQKLTHINHAGVSFGAKGNLKVPDGFLEPALISHAHAAGVKVVLLRAGDFPGVETDPTALPNVIKKLAEVRRRQRLRRMDIDWEYPSSALDEHTSSAIYAQVYTEHALLGHEAFKLKLRQRPAHSYSLNFYGLNGNCVFHYGGWLAATWKDNTLTGGYRQQFGPQDGVPNAHYWEFSFSRQLFKIARTN